MEIFNASVEGIADVFLHPGYMSAYVEANAPAQMTGAIIPVDKEPVMQIDMERALRLADGTPDSSASGYSGVVEEGAATGMSSSLAVAVAVIGVLACVAALPRGQRIGRRRVGMSAVALAGIAAAMAIVACGRKEVPAPPEVASRPAPSQTIPRTNYPFADPQAATLAILHGIIADSVASSRTANIADLSHVASEVGLPAANLTPGMRYAIVNFKEDGWGRDFRMAPTKDHRFTITSAGADGSFDTADDLSITAERPDPYNWPSKVHAIFLRKTDDGVAVLYHRYAPGKSTMRYRDRAGAERMTGTSLYDLLGTKQFTSDQKARLAKRVESIVERPGALAMVVFDPKHMGKPVLERVLYPTW